MEQATTAIDTPNAGREGTISRRQFLTATGKGVAASVTVASTVGAAQAAQSHADSKPNHVTLSYDEAWLNDYQPMLDLTAVPHDNRPTLYAWRASSPEEGTDVGVYCCGYPVQKDVLRLTSHAGDHEWIYVHVDPATGEVVEVDYTAYHWLRGYITNPTVSTSDGGVHAPVTVAPTYHHYLPDAEARSEHTLLDTTRLADYQSQSGPLYRWLDNGMDADLARGAVHNPWLLDRNGPLESWWSETRSGRTNQSIASTWAFISFTIGVGIRGGENADPGEADL